MDYTFDSYHKNGVRFDSTTRIEDIQAKFDELDFVKILDNKSTSHIPLAHIYSEEQLIEWNMSKAFSAQWKPSVPDKACGNDRVKWNPLEESDGFHVKVSGAAPMSVFKDGKKIVEISGKDHINPSHYQAYIKTENEELQWLEAMQYLPRFRDPEKFKAAVELQGRKYFDRNGGKDAELQELQKGLWYFKFLVAYIKNGNKPIRVKDIDTILNRK
ncbi:hypothetical protein [Flavobacterium sp.]|jgi:hypothetical protein|uniref:hypothetical protein n=1 Tax=Flavobacterium sp. TaxID=239 RepID=UPI0037BE80EF